MRAALDLALNYGKGPLQIKAIAKNEDISNKYLEQLISILKAAGIVRSIRGPKGGYMLSRPPAEITLNEVFSVLEGPFVPVECIEDTDACGKCPECAIREVWCNLKNAIEGVLNDVTLEDLAKKSEGLHETVNYQI